MKRKAFTLIELMIVIAVIAILAGITTVGWGNYRKNIEEKKVKSDIQMIMTALENEKNFKNGYPASLPNTVNASDGVDLAYIKEGNGYCIQAKSTKDPSISYYVRSSSGSNLQTGNCVPPPAAPVATATATSSSSIRVTWSSVSGATSYTVRYGTSSPTTTASCNSSPCNISTLSSSTTYRFSVTATNASGSSTSATVTATTPAPYTCPEGGTLNGTTCTETYAASYQNGTSAYYYCPNGGTLNGTSCTTSSSYAASYQSGSSGYYYCPNGGSLNGTTCTTSSSYPASSSTSYSCSRGGSQVSGANYPLCRRTYAATASTSYSCEHPARDSQGGSNCSHRTNETVRSSCESSGNYWYSGSCYYNHPATASTTYSCPSGGYLSGTTCVDEYDATPTTTYSCPSGGTRNSYDPTTCYTVSSYNASYSPASSGYYYCPNGGSLSGSTCYTSSSYNASYSPGSSGYYYCSRGGTLNGTTCTRTYAATQG